MKRSVWLWVLQGLLAILFLFAGGAKLVMPVSFMQQGPVVLPGWFLHFIGVAEVLGGLGLILPGMVLQKFDPSATLTRLAAIGLTAIMVGAVGVSAYGTGIVSAIFPFVVGLLLSVVIVMRAQAVV
jgi:hypothetical protein